MNRRVCNICLNDETVSEITFNADGICSYCEEFENWRHKLENYTALEQLWLERVEKYRGKGRYDALMGISGGKDSAYVLHHLVNNYKLRVKAFTFENGFLTDWARQRIKSIVEELQVDHSFVRYPEEVLSGQYKTAIKLTGAPCAACSIILYATSVALAMKLYIPMAIHGRSRPQMLRYFSKGSNDPFIPFVYVALEHAGETDLSAVYNEVIRKIKRKFSEETLRAVEEYFPELSGEKCVEFVPYFLYHRYDEREIVNFLETKTTWEKPDGYDLLTHFDCIVHDAAGYLYEIAEGRPHILPELSFMIRAGFISKDQALERFKKEKFGAMPVRSMEELARYTRLEVHDLISLAENVVQKRQG